MGINIEIDHSLAGTNADAEEGEGIINGSNNIFGVDPMLSKLADNGGSTFTMLPKAAAPDMGAVEVIPGDETPTKKKKSDGLFGSVGFGSLMAMFALVGLRRKCK